MYLLGPQQEQAVLEDGLSSMRIACFSNKTHRYCLHRYCLRDHRCSLGGFWATLIGLYNSVGPTHVMIRLCCISYQSPQRIRELRFFMKVKLFGETLLFPLIARPESFIFIKFDSQKVSYNDHFESPKGIFSGPWNTQVG